MGKSDRFLLPTYGQRIKEWFGTKSFRDVAFLGQVNENELTSEIITSGKRDFFDMQLGNWNINDNVWKIDKHSYDFIVCTRCAYFARSPIDFLSKCHEILKPGGGAFIDWGLGDHWRFENYKVGWVKDGEHEYAYEENNYLWSAVWHPLFNDEPEVKNFANLVKNKGYHDLFKAVLEEVPEVLDLRTTQGHFESMDADLLSLWEEKPQLYIPVGFIGAIK